MGEIGLALTRMICRRRRGEVTVRSTDIGTEFVARGTVDSATGSDAATALLADPLGRGTGEGAGRGLDSSGARPAETAMADPGPGDVWPVAAGSTRAGAPGR